MGNEIPSGPETTTRAALGGYSTVRQNEKVGNSEREDIGNLLRGQMGEDVDEDALKEAIEDYYKTNIAPDEGSEKLTFTKVIQGIAAKFTGNRGVDRHVRSEAQDNAKGNGFKGGYKTGFDYEHSGDYNDKVDVLARLGKEHNLTVASKEDTMEQLGKLGFALDKTDEDGKPIYGDYDANNGAFKRTHLNEKGESVDSYLKVLQDENGKNYLVSTDITNGHIETSVYGIDKKTGDLSLIENPDKASGDGETPPTPTDPQTLSTEKYDSLSDDDKAKVDSQLKNQPWEQVYSEFKDKTDDLSSKSQYFQSFGWNADLSDAIQEKMQANVALIGQIDQNGGKVTPEVLKTLESAGLDTEQLSQIIGKPVTVAQSETAPQETTPPQDTGALNDPAPTPWDEPAKERN